MAIIVDTATYSAQYQQQEETTGATMISIKTVVKSVPTKLVIPVLRRVGNHTAIRHTVAVIVYQLHIIQRD